MTTSSATSVRTATIDERERALGMLTLAFSTDPVFRWLYPDTGDYLMYFPRLASLLGDSAFETRTGYFTDDGGAVALWLPPGATQERDPLRDLFVRSLPPERHEGVFAVMGQMANYHPHDPYWYLSLIAVDPVRQGQGLGSALLRHTLAGVDRQHITAYLVSSNPRNNPLYERHGFEVIGEIQAGASPTLYPMLRKAR